jgi:hypothetical protein
MEFLMNPTIGAQDGVFRILDSGIISGTKPILKFFL